MKKVSNCAEHLHGIYIIQKIHTRGDLFHFSEACVCHRPDIGETFSSPISKTCGLRPSTNMLK